MSESFIDINNGACSLEVYKLKNSFEIELEKLENKKMETFQSLHPYAIDDELYCVGNFLYHGIRFQDKLEKLESIFRDGKIKAGNYIKNYYPYDDNCNDGEYISLIDYPRESNLEYNTFIKENISLVISPRCKAYKTIYVPYELWKEIKKIPNLKNRYSYARCEYQVKEFIPLKKVKAIGIPYRYLVKNNKKEVADFYRAEVIRLLEKYDVDIPIVDTSFFNDIIYIRNKNKVYKKGL